MEQQYDNTLTPELKASLEQPYFSAEQKSAMSEDGRKQVEAQEAFLREHPVTAIYRVAVDGSLTERGGVVRPSYNGSSDKCKVNVALEGDEVVYPDGTTALIITSSGKSIRKNSLCSSARFDNADAAVVLLNLLL